MFEGPEGVWWGDCGGSWEARALPPLPVCRLGPWANRPAHLESKELDQMISRALLENILGFSQPLIWPLIERTFPALLCLDVLS